MAAPARASERWVAPGGHDVPTSGTRDDPWATLQYAADRARPGDTVHVRSGRYAGFYLGAGRNAGGAEGQPVAFLAEPGAAVVRPNKETPDGINLERADFVILEGFDIAGMPRAGIRMTGCRGAVVRRNRATDNGRWGIYASFVDGAVIEDNEAARSRTQHGIYVANSSRRPVVRGNRVWGNPLCGLHLNGDASQGGVGVILDAVVERNVFWDNGRAGGSGVNCDGVQRSIIRNNLLYENHGYGVSLYRTDGAAGSSHNQVVNNTVVQAADGRWALNIKG